MNEREAQDALIFPSLPDATYQLLCAMLADSIPDTIGRMNTFSNAFRAEVVRMARKELKPELQSMRKAITSHRSEIAALKRDVKNLTSQLKAAQRQTKAVQTALPSGQPTVAKRASGQAFVFNPAMLAQMRQALGATQLEMASLLAVSPLSYSRWEKGQAHPRAKQLAKIEEALRMGPRVAEKKIRQAANA
ncbi:helix-turn-helix transcriptional regulator [Acidovorax sp. 56]|uniref:helix-turn-helix domain-containing protein n=1 Tax=Acidovorax sp. 56 TaxID=2035205 RepID=UPI001E2D1FC3|nr:helix-turn-helix transcriptional regulator [Acidovorax sp. 56]